VTGCHADGDVQLAARLDSPKEMTPPEVGEGASQLYTCPKVAGQSARKPFASAPPAVAGGSGEIIINLDHLNLKPFLQHPSLERVQRAADSGNSSPTGLDVFGDSASSRWSNPEGSMKDNQLPADMSLYRLAVRAVMVAWENPLRNLVQRLQMADLLALCFAVEQPAHMDGLRRALAANRRVATELQARIAAFATGGGGGEPYPGEEDFAEAVAAKEWRAAEAAELRALLQKQQRLPAFNAALELGVLQGVDLKVKKRNDMMCLNPVADSNWHYVALEVASHDKKAAKAPERHTMSTPSASGQSPVWNCKCKPILMSREAPASLQMQVAISRPGYYDTSGTEASSKYSVGWTGLDLWEGGGKQPEMSYVVPVARTLSLVKKKKSSSWYTSSDAVPDDVKHLQAKGKPRGGVKMVIRFVPERRDVSSTASGSGSLAAMAACPSSKEAADNFQALLDRLWKCWASGIEPHHGSHTFSIEGDDSDQEAATAEMEFRAADSTAFQLDLSGESKSVMVGEASGRYYPGKPWLSILEAFVRLYRVRWVWKKLLITRRMLANWHLEPQYLQALRQLWEPIVEVARDGKLTRREGMLHVSCIKSIVKNCIAALELYHSAFSEERSVEQAVEGLRHLLALTALAIRYDTAADSLVEPLKIHVKRNVRRRMKAVLPKSSMSQGKIVTALQSAVSLAITSLRHDLQLAAGFPESLDLPLYTARLRYKQISHVMLQVFTGPGVVAYDKSVMALQDKLTQLHELMLDARISVPNDEPAGEEHVTLLAIDMLMGRSLLKWVRDIGLNMKDWVDGAVAADAGSGWTPVGNQARYTSSVVDLLRIFTEVVEQTKERMPELEEQSALHSEAYEKLQIGIHYVLRHFARVLEGHCLESIRQAQYARRQSLGSQEQAAKVEPETVIEMISGISQISEPCISSKVCMLLNNIETLQANADNLQERLYDAICGEPPQTDPDNVEDTLSEVSFLSTDEMGDDQDAVLRDMPAMDDQLQHADRGQFFLQAEEGASGNAERVSSHLTGLHVPLRLLAQLVWQASLLPLGLPWKLSGFN